MKKIVSALFINICLFGCTTSLNKHDSWLGEDKVYHLLTASAIGAASTKAAVNNGVAPCDAVLIGISASITIGAGKELYDKNIKKTFFSWKDMFWNFAGGALGGLATREC